MLLKSLNTTGAWPKEIITTLLVTLRFLIQADQQASAKPISCDGSGSCSNDVLQSSTVQC